MASAAILRPLLTALDDELPHGQVAAKFADECRLLGCLVGQAPDRTHGLPGRSALDRPGRLGHNRRMIDNPRRYAPSAARNRDAILKTLSLHLPEFGRVLEFASGSGEHTMHFATAHPKLMFQPSDPDPDGRARIDAWTRHLRLTNVAPAIELDAAQSVSVSIRADIVICINMLHIAPWPAAVGLIRRALSAEWRTDGPRQCGVRL